MTFAPIVLFAYNRPSHTRKTLDALAQNTEASESILYIYCDGIKKETDHKSQEAVNKVRVIADTESRFKEVVVIKRAQNFGLARNIKEGVSAVVNQYGNVIVLEDDIVVSSGFLKYMNDALSFYKNDTEVMHISGYMYPHEKKLPETFFYNVTLCWGWATWKDSWSHFNGNAIALWHTINTRGLFQNLDAFGEDYLSRQLASNITGDLDTWFVKWHSSVLLSGGITLFPCTSLVNNIGFDNSGVHNGNNDEFDHKILATNVSVASQPKIINTQAREIITSFYKSLKKQRSTGLWSKIILKVKTLIYKFIPDLKRLKNKTINSHVGSKGKLYPTATLINSIVGNYTYVSENSSFKNTVVGKFCSIGPNLISGWGIHPTNGVSTHPMFYSTSSQNGMTLSTVNKIQEFEPITIGNDVFIGMNVTILDGVTIGDGAIIGAGSVVSKNVPDYAIAVGNPIKVVKHRFNPEQIAKLKSIKWWNFSQNDLQLVEENFMDIDQFIEAAAANKDALSNTNIPVND